jgi:hypothetical protein
MTTPIVIETFRNGNPVGTPNANGQGTQATARGDRARARQDRTDADLCSPSHSDLGPRRGLTSTTRVPHGETKQGSRALTDNHLRLD